MPHLTLTREIAAPAEAVFETLTDHSAYPDFTPLRRVELERSGEEAPNGVGAIRVLHLAGPPIRERVTAYEPPSMLSYEVLSGIPVRKQTATVTIEPRGDGACSLRYEIAIEPRIPLSGPLLGLITKTAIGRMVDAVAGEAARRAASGSAPAPAGV
jgi:uncharacterized protein YndB with AHSA1/START domain